MMKRSVLPPMRNSLNINSTDLGSFDTLAFRAQLPKRPRRVTAYDEIATLSARMESLKNENEMMQIELVEEVSRNDGPFFRL